MTPILSTETEARSWCSDVAKKLVLGLFVTAMAGENCGRDNASRSMCPPMSVGFANKSTSW
jgi:hypothetical protein